MIRWMMAPEAAKFVGMSTQQLQWAVQRDEIPFYGTQDRPRFDQALLAEWLRAPTRAMDRRDQDRARWRYRKEKNQ